MSSQNLGQQDKTWVYRHPARAEDFNTLLREGIEPGIYRWQGQNDIPKSCIKIEGNSTIVINPFVAYFNVDDELMIRIRTRTHITYSVSSSTPIITMSFTWLNVTENYIDFWARSSYSQVGSNEIILGELIYVNDGTVLQEINYDNTLWGLKSTTVIRKSNETYPRSDAIYNEFLSMDNKLNKEIENLEKKINDLVLSASGQNLIYNGDFKYFSNNLYDSLDDSSSLLNVFTPDGFLESGTVNSRLMIDEGGYKCTVDSDYSLQQVISEFPGWQNYLRGQTITFKVRMTATKGAVITINEINTTVIPASVPMADYEVTTIIPLSASAVYIRLYTNEDDSIFDIRMMGCNLGLTGSLYLPCIVQGVIGETKTYNILDIANVPRTELLLAGGNADTDGYTRLASVVRERFGLHGTLPDMRGYFERAVRGSAKGIDPDYLDRNDGRGDGNLGDYVGTIQQDAIRNIVGVVDRTSDARRLIRQAPPGVEFTGVFRNITTPSLGGYVQTTDGGGVRGCINLDLLQNIYSITNPTGTYPSGYVSVRSKIINGRSYLGESRPTNQNVLKTIKWS